MTVMLTGGHGMLGKSIQRAWADSGEQLRAVGRSDADLTDISEVRAMLDRLKPDAIIHTAAKVGGIAANMNSQSAFLMDNLLIDSSVLKTALETGVRRVIYIGSSCMYPKDFRQPLVEGDVLAGPLEPTNEGYAIAKIAGARYCQYVSEKFGVDFNVIIPSNLYGPDDDYSPQLGHLVASALRKAHEAKVTGAKSIDVWGDGLARREFTYVGDLASWLATAFSSIGTWPSLMNVGLGIDHSVIEYYRNALDTVGYDCDLVTDPSKPAGMRQKLMDSSLARDFGWSPATGMAEGMRRAYERFLITSAAAG